MASRWLAPFVALSIGCSVTPSFSIRADEVPRLSGDTVRTIRGEVEKVPERWEAKVIPVGNVDSVRLMVPPGDAPAQAWLVPEGGVEEAERAGWSGREIRFESPLEGGIGAPGAWQAERRAAPTAPPVPAPGQPWMLWVRTTEGRIVELPVHLVDRVRVDGKRDPGMGSGKGAMIAAIVVGGVLVAVLVGVTAVTAIDAMGNR